MTKHYTSQPYNDDAQHALDSRYDLLVGNPGRTLQSREFTQIQSLAQEYVKRLGDTIHPNGTIISGMNLVLQGTTVQIVAGTIYLDGMIRSTDGGKVSISGKGKETINVSVSYKLVTDTDDNSLLDPVAGYDNENKPGAYRNQYTVTFSVNNPDAPAIYTLVDGVVQSTAADNDAEYNSIMDILERRTYEESGNYRVNGLQVYNPATPITDDKTISLRVTAGTVFIQGHEVTKPVDTMFQVAKAITTSNSINELKNYKDGTLTYELNNQWAHSINRVTMNVYQEKSMTRGGTKDGKDTLTTVGSSVLDILSVTDGTKTYAYGTDFTLDDDNSTINWAPAGAEPATGSTYVVDMVVTQDVDPKLYSLNSDTNSIVLDGKAPVPYHKDNTKYTSVFKVEYDFYLPRRDLVLIDEDSVLSDLQGNPNLTDQLVAPVNNDPTKLALAMVTIYPQTDVVDVYDTGKTRMTMDDLFQLKQQVNNIENNLSITNLDRAARDGEDATLLTGILTDAFANSKKIDFSHPDYKGAIDLINNQFTVGGSDIVTALTPDDNNATTRYAKVGPYLTAPFTEQASVSQLTTTGVINVNEYLVFGSHALIDLKPSVDNWIDEQHITANQTEHNTVNQYRSGGTQYYYTIGGAYDTTSTSSSTSTTTSSAVTTDEVLATYMRQSVVTVTGSNFYPFSDNISATFNDIPVAMTPTGTAQAGTNKGSVRADANGQFTGTFTIPANVESGSVQVKVDSARPGEEATAVFTSKGLTKRIITTITTDIVTTNTITTVHHVDPVAQTFLADTNTTLSSVGLYFSAKDTAKPIIVEIHDTTNGNPSDNILSQKIVYPSDINTSADGSAETKVTFDDIIQIQKDHYYAVAILTDSDKYFMYKASIGESQLGTTQALTIQPYSNGSLFTSSDGTAWVADPKSDLKFKVYTAVYNPAGGNIIFNAPKLTNFNRLLMATELVDTTNAGIVWSYSTDAGKTWGTLDNWTPTDLGTTVNAALIKVKINTKDGMSAMILADCINLVTYLDDTGFAYVSRNVKVDTNYSNVKISVDSNYQTNNALSMHVYYTSDTDGKSWTELTKPTVTVVNQDLGHELDRFVFVAPKLTTAANNYRVKVTMDTNDISVRPVIGRLINIMEI